MFSSRRRERFEAVWENYGMVFDRERYETRTEKETNNQKDPGESEGKKKE